MHNNDDYSFVLIAFGYSFYCSNRHNSTLTELYLNKNNVGHDGALALAKALTYNCTLIRVGATKRERVSE
jgi:hypothetical protein